jgi:signal transduction histidine kinase
MPAGGRAGGRAVITSRLFRTHFAIAAISIFSCVFVGSWVLNFVVQRIEATQETHRRQRQTPIFFAHFIEQFGAKDPILGLKRLQALQGQDDPIRFAILDEHGKLLYPVGMDVPEVTDLPPTPYESMELYPHGIPKHSPFAFLTGGPHPGPPPFSLMRLSFQPPRYLLIKYRPPTVGLGPRFFPLSFFVMILMVLVGIAVALAMIFRSLREHVVAADHVISELQKGNLKARFPVERHDEIGNAKMRFNAMACEIERLVERLRSAESSRNNLLQELAHDLRTPVASLQSILESVFSSAEMEPDVAELAELAKKEVDYLGHLVEDLLLLAQLSEPSYQPNRQAVDFLALLEEESDSIALRKDNIHLEKRILAEEALLKGDEHLFRRLVRNALENAFSYARSRVSVEASLDPGGQLLRVTIRDDGPGFDADSLAKFGERRGQRMIKKSQGGRLSLGLGSVIMKSVIVLHRGELKASNNPTGGAAVEFALRAGA